jgi:hypothetical protein
MDWETVRGAMKRTCPHNLKHACKQTESKLDLSTIKKTKQGDCVNARSNSVVEAT